MLRYQFFPRSQGITKEMGRVISCFEQEADKINSETGNLKSNDVLKIVAPHLESIGFKVERGRMPDQKIDVPVLFGMNNKVDKSFYADAISDDGKIVVEIEAGRATENNQFLKDIFEACMMHNVEYLVIAVRNTYRTHSDFEPCYTFLETLYASNRLHLPLNGILLIGY